MLLIFALVFGPPVLLVILGVIRKQEKPGTAKALFILAAVYTLVGGGICASILSNISIGH